MSRAILLAARRDVGYQGLAVHDPWHVGAEFGLDLAHVWARAGKGETEDGGRIHVAILDSGVAKTAGLPEDRITQFTPTGQRTQRRDRTGTFHGTQVASVLACDAPETIGVAPAVKCSCFNVYNVQQQPSEARVITAFQQAVAMHVDVICCTFTLEHISPALRQRIAAARAALIPIVVSAGNTNRVSPFPESADGLICIAASSVLKTVLDGRLEPPTLVAAPGIQIPASIPNSVSEFSGTSAAAPVAAGIIALALAHAKKRGVEEWFRRELPDLLVRTANRATNPPLLDAPALLRAIDDKAS